MTAALILVGGCGDPADGCDESSSAVAYARSIPKDRLAQLYRDAKAQLKSGQTLQRAGPGTGNGPTWLDDLTYRNVILDNARTRILLRGCFDHFVFIQINGISDRRSFYGNSLLLVWGEGPTAGSEVLWSE